jgi:hypothetical protein
MHASELLLFIPFQATNSYNFSLTHALLRQLPSPVLGISDDETIGNGSVAWSSILAPAPSSHWNISAWRGAAAAVMQRSFGLKPGSRSYYFVTLSLLVSFVRQSSWSYLAITVSAHHLPTPRPQRYVPSPFHCGKGGPAKDMIGRSHKVLSVSFLFHICQRCVTTRGKGDPLLVAAVTSRTPLSSSRCKNCAGCLF